MIVDVILPTYNGEQWVGEAIDSVFQQTYPHWHLTVVDDASSDKTVERVREIQDGHPDLISLICLEENRRAAGARMVAVAQTTGDIVAFIDQDDRWLPDKLARQIARLSIDPKVDAVHADIEFINSYGEVIPSLADKENQLRAHIPYDQLSNRELVTVLVMRNSIRLISSVVRRSAFDAIGGFDTSLFGGEDWEFWVRFADRFRIGHQPYSLVQRRIHGRNASIVYRYARKAGRLAALAKIEQSHPYLRQHISEKRNQLLREAMLAALLSGYVGKAFLHAWALFKFRLCHNL